MNLLDDIRSDLITESASVSNTLRKAKILASELGLPEFKEWVDSELNGYPDKTKVPRYRSSKTHNIGTFSGSFGSMARGLVLPISNLPSPVKEFAQNLVLMQGVGELEGLLKQGSEQFRNVWPQEYVMRVQDELELTDGSKLVAAHQPILPAKIEGVLDKVKNKLLDFILSLQENNVTSERLKSGEVKQEAVRNFFNINIYGDHNVVASGENVQQQVKDIRKGDVESLVDYLRQYKVGKSDLSELEKAVSAEPVSSGGQFGPKVQGWIGKMVAKASSGAWRISLATAPSVLIEALRRFYGG